jgi:hypothetical protein
VDNATHKNVLGIKGMDMECFDSMFCFVFFFFFFFFFFGGGGGWWIARRLGIHSCPSSGTI